MSSEIELRPVAAEDEPFLRRLFESTRPDLALLPMPTEQRATLLDMQYRAQRQQYDAAFPEATHDLIVVGGAAVGSIRFYRSPEGNHLVDISLVSEARRKGIGTRVLLQLLDEARQSQRPITLHVAQNNPARRLYEWLGFVEISADSVYCRMRFTP